MLSLESSWTLPFTQQLQSFIMMKRYRSFVSFGLNLSDKAFFDARGIDDKSLKSYKASGNHEDFVNFCPKPFIFLSG